MAAQEWTLKRNCSLTPRQLGLFYASLCLASLSVAGMFAVFGVRFVLSFALLEMAAVGLAFLIYARHATDRERITLVGDSLLVELVEAEQTRKFQFNRYLTRVEFPLSRHGLVRLEAVGMRVEVGQFLTAPKRREFALELTRELRRGLAAAK